MLSTRVSGDNVGPLMSVAEPEGVDTNLHQRGHGFSVSVSHTLRTGTFGAFGRAPEARQCLARMSALPEASSVLARRPKTN